MNVNLLVAFVMTVNTMLGVRFPDSPQPSPKSENQSGTDTITASKPDTLRKLHNGAFAGGEYLRFDINYSFVTAAEAVMKTRDTIYNGRKCHVVEFTLTSKPFFD